MHRYQILIEYVGTNFVGWQIQSKGKSVQKLIQTKLSKLLKEKIFLIGSGRTDAGVHALDYYFNCKVNHELSFSILHKLNHLCSSDIAFKNLWRVPDDFSARFDALERSYIYHINTKKNPLNQDFSLWHSLKLNVKEMNKACERLLGRQDFECFSKAKTEVNNFFCNITHAQFTQNDDEIVFTITANRFLRNMVRAIVGSLLDIGTGKNNAEHIKTIIASKKRNMAGRSVAAKALFLSEIKYDKTQWLKIK